MGYLNGVHWQDFMDVMVVGMVVFHGVKCGFKGYILTPTREELQDVEHAMAYPIVWTTPAQDLPTTGQ